MRRTLHVVAILALAAAAQAGEVVNWSSGVAYTYDGSGNVSQIGNDKFVYDDVGRIVRAQVNGAVRVYGFDAFGNRTKCSQDNGGTDCRYFTVDANDNRITGATYDGAGNVTKLGPHTYTYDLDNMMTRDDYNGAPREFIYTAEDERIAVYNVSPHTWDWTVRDTGGRPLRDFTSRDGANLGTDDLTWSKDYVWRDGGLLASRQREGTTPTASTTTTYHYHLDHLGTPRRITNDTDAIVGAHDYYPFGPEISGGLEEPSTTRLKYTGHERDAGTDEYTLDYMHARYYNGALGSFLSVDPILDIRRSLTHPQRWGRYGYAINSPLAYVDPTGQEVSLAPLSQPDQQTLLQSLNQFTGNVYETDGNGDLALVSYGANASAAASQFLDGAIAATDVYTVNGVFGDKSVVFGNRRGNTITLDFKDFTALKYNGINPSTFSLGSTLIHELIHAHNGIEDPPSALQNSTTGPVVDMVNVMRAQRGFELRGPTYSGPGTLDAHGQVDTLRVPFIVHRGTFLRILLGNEGGIDAKNF